MITSCTGESDDSNLAPECKSESSSDIYGLKDGETIFTERNLTSGSKPAEAKLVLETLNEPKYPDNDVIKSLVIA